METMTDDTAPPTIRSREYERNFLIEAARLAGLTAPTYVERTANRLEMGQQLYGDRWSTWSPDHLCREILEEIEDVATWSVLLAQRLGHDHPAVEHLLNVVSMAASADNAMRAVRALVKDHSVPEHPISESGESPK